MVGGEHALGVDAVPRVALSREVIDHRRRLVCDAGPPTLYEMWEIVVLFELLACLLVRMAWSFLLSARSSMYFISGTSSILLCQISSGDNLASARMRVRYSAMVAAAVARARLFENPAASAATATLAASLLRSTVKSTPGSVSSKSLMSKRMFSFRSGEGSEIHQMAVAAGLDGGNSGSRLMP